MPDMLKPAEIRLGRQYRTAPLLRDQIIEEQRTVPLSFSSEEPFERWWGVEILGHKAGEIDLGWMDGGTAPLLLDHDARDQVGVLSDVAIGADAKGRAVARFGRSARAEEIYRDVLDGIRRNVSVGYEIKELRLESEADGVSTYRVTKWRPLEVSIVSVPADMAVGIGRAADEAEPKPIPVIHAKESRAMPEATVDTDKTTIAAIAKTDPSPDEVLAAERKRVADITDLAARHNSRALGDKAIRLGMAFDLFKGVIADMLPDGKALQAPVGDLGLSKKEVQQFSILRAIQAQLPNSPVKAEFERECSAAVAKQMGISGRGILVPSDVLMRGRVEKRDLVVGTATAGGNTVATELDAANMIDLLRNRMMVRRMGARILSGLQGNIAIPKQTGAATAYWLSESGAPTESQQTIGQVTMSPKTVGAFTDYSRQLLLQSTIDVEGFVRDDLAMCLALGLDLAALHGTGQNNQPTGLSVVTGPTAVDHGATGGPPTWAKVVEFETGVSTLNADVGTLGYLTNAKVRGKMKTTEVSSGTAVFLWPDVMGPEPGFGFINGYRAGVSNQVRADYTDGAGSSLSAMFFGNWADLIIGEWGVLDIMVNPYTGADAGTTRVHAFLSADIAFRRTESFSRAMDISTS